MGLDFINVLISMPDLRLARERMKPQDEQAKLEETIFYSLVLIAGIIFLFIREGDPVLAGKILLIILVIVLLAGAVRGRGTKDMESGTEAPVREEIVHSKDLRAVYAGIVSSFVLLVIFCIMLEFYPVRALEFLTPYTEYIFLAGAAVIFLLGVFYRRREEINRQTQ